MAPGGLLCLKWTGFSLQGAREPVEFEPAVAEFIVIAFNSEGGLRRVVVEKIWKGWTAETQRLESGDPPLQGHVRLNST